LAGHVEELEKMRNSYGILAENLKEGDCLGDQESEDGKLLLHGS